AVRTDRQGVTGALLDRFARVAGRGGHNAVVSGYDSGHVTADLSNCVAEHIGVFERDAGDRTRYRIDDAGRVVAPAETDFENGDVDRLPAELPECHPGEHLEKGGSIAV